MSFLNNYPRFKQGHNAGKNLQLRIDTVFNAVDVKGKTVTDIGCHDGRFTFGCLLNGASFVTGIEPREKEYNSCIENLKEYWTEDNWQIIKDDVFNVDFKSDVILCLGFLYHTIKHGELFEKFRGAKQVVIDTNIFNTDQPNIKLKQENTDQRQNSFIEKVVGIPSLKSIKMLGNANGFNVTEIKRYIHGQRVTLLLEEK